jgi:hypothetical protein
MSNPDSFIDEVTEEVRRDRLFATFRKYGWIAILIVLGVVGTAAVFEWRKAQARAAAEAFGDGLLAALEAPTPADRAAALTAVAAAGDQAAVRALMVASDPAADRAGAIAALEGLAADAAASQIYRDLATLRLVALQGTDRPLADRRAALDAIAVPGRTFRTLALEQLAYLDIEAGDAAAAITRLQALTEDQESTQSLRARARQVIVALGGKA